MRLETEVPTRATIAGWLAEIPKKKGKTTDKKSRNATRKAKVKASVPAEVFEVLETDLVSYPEWEVEQDDET